MPTFLETFRQDLRFAFRNLLQAPGFLAVVILSLALGIAANSTIFSVINAVLYRPLPYPHPERLVVIWETQTDKPDSRQPAPIAELLDWQQQNDVFDDIALTSENESSNMAGLGEPQSITVQDVTPNFFALLGVQPRLGRIFLPDEMQDRTQAVVISDVFWHKHYNASPDVLGRSFVVQGVVSTVVGVMPPGFAPMYGRAPDLWQPVNPASSRYSARIDHWLVAIGRMKPGVTIAQAQTEMEVIARRLESAYPATNKGIGEKLADLHDTLFGYAAKYLYPLLGAVAFVLLIGCVNVANLLQSRTEARRREYALRSALGAGRGRLIQQLLTESGLLAMMGGALGVALTYAGIPLFVALAGDIPSASKIAVDGRVLLFTLGISLFTAILFGLAPALQASQPDLNATLREGERGGLSVSRGFARNTLAVVEIALAMVLLVGAGLMIDSILRVQRVDPGFDTKNVLTAGIQLPEGGQYVELIPGGDMQRPSPHVNAFYQQLIQKLSALPGIESVSSASALPLAGYAPGYSFSILAHPATEPKNRPRAGMIEVSPGFFETMRIPLRKGRYLSEHDNAAAPWALVINETLARRFFPNEDPIGQQVHIQFGSYAVDEDHPRQIVGIVGDVKQMGLGQVSPALMYASSLQQNAVFPGGATTLHTTQGIVLRTTTALKPREEELTAAIRRSVAELDPAQPVIDPISIDGLLDFSVSDFRFYGNILEIFAGIALLLALIGIYGVMSYFVTQRTREIGIRVALGAEQRDVLGLIGKLGFKLALAGVVGGATMALGLTRLITTFLYDVKPSDPLTYTVVGAGLVAVALLACFIPARRALQVDPMVALRHE